MRTAETPRKCDGELYYTIENGVRLSGMPAFGGQEAHGGADTPPSAEPRSHPCDAAQRRKARGTHRSDWCIRNFGTLSVRVDVRMAELTPSRASRDKQN